MKYPGKPENKKLIIYIIVVIGSFLIFSLVQEQPKVSIKPVKEDKMNETEKLAKKYLELEKRLLRLEPKTPVKIVSAEQSPLPDEMPVLTVVEEGVQIPFEKVYENITWIRPDYQPYWHSKQDRFNSIPDKINNAYHRLFVTQGAEVLWEETAHNSGIAELADKIQLPKYQGSFDNTVGIVVLQHKVSEIFMLGNQIVLLGTPSRTGVQVLALNKADIIKTVTGDLIAKNNSIKFLFQMVTPDGYEIDFKTAVLSLN